MARHLATLLVGTLFGAGLAMSQMVDRARILGFLDVAGAWDPTLLYVMIGAAGTALVLFRFVLRLPKPVLEVRFTLADRKGFDRPLVLGSALFGIGWGLSGYCPGPGVSLLALGIWPAFVFIGAVAAGSYLYRAGSGASDSEYSCS
ncbi:MAG TPA: DUF6691 family protein [bacterium]